MPTALWVATPLPPSILRLSLRVPREEPSVGGGGGTRVADGEEIVGQESPMKNDRAERGQSGMAEGPRLVCLAEPPTCLRTL